MTVDMPPHLAVSGLDCFLASSFDRSAAKELIASFDGSEVG